MDLYVWGEMKINVLCCYVRVFEQYIHIYAVYVPIYKHRIYGAIVHVSLLYLYTYIRLAILVSSKLNDFVLCFSAAKMYVYIPDEYKF